MSKLLIANFARIKKNKLFYCLCAVCAVFALFTVINQISNKGGVDSAFRLFAVPIEAVAAVFISTFFGTEYSDGTIRNKLIIGHSRYSVYFANLITAIVCVTAMFVSFTVPVLTVGLPCLGLPDAETVRILVAGFVTLLAFCSLFTMISTVYSNKAGATAINIVLVFTLIIAGLVLSAYLMQPQYYAVQGAEGMEYVANPNYPTGVKRAILVFFSNASLAGQSVQFITALASPLWVMSVYSVVIFIICAVTGTLIFNGKNIK